MHMSTPAQPSWHGLLSPDPDQVGHAADSLFESPNAKQALADPKAADALIVAVKAGNRTASTVLLLGYTKKGEPVLKELLAAHANDPVKLHPWSRLVPLQNAALAALSRLGDRKSRETLLQHTAGYNNAERIFVLDLLSYFDAPEIWHAASGYLSDETEIPEDVPSGAAKRRVCDHAVDAFLSALSLPVKFEKKPGGRYDPSEIQQVRDALRSSVPQ
jgi:hypothetical protein